MAAITGIGMVCPLGVSTSQCWQNMVQGKSGIRRITRFNPDSCATQIAGEIPESYALIEKNLFPSPVKKPDLALSLGISAAIQAFSDSDIANTPIDPKKISVITGSGGSFFGEALNLRVNGDIQNREYSSDDPVYATLPNQISNVFGFKGAAFNIATACASGSHAVAHGYEWVTREGGISLVVGVDAMIREDVIKGFNHLMALSEHNQYPEKASRPFDKRRSGFVISEGACALMLEPYEDAIRRGARIYSVITGYASTSEAYNIMAPEPEGNGMALTMEMAIRHSGIPIENIGYINAHGTSTPHNDRTETRAIKKVFGKDAYRIPVSSQKSMIGHALGAAGAIEAGITALTLHHQVITPTINYVETGLECDLDYVPNHARQAKIEAAISNSFGFGGHNCTLVLERHHVIT